MPPAPPDRTPPRPGGNKPLGDRGEKLAAGYLADRGWMILHRNYRIGHREIDLVARRDEVVDRRARPLLALLLQPALRLVGDLGDRDILAVNARQRLRAQAAAERPRRVDACHHERDGDQPEQAEKQRRLGAAAHLGEHEPSGKG